MTPAIEVDSIRKSYASAVVLDGVSLTVPSGVYALLGPNGAGKTTFVNVLTTLLRPDGGTARICGVPLPQRRTVRRLISVTGQLAAVDELLTVTENLVVVARLLGLDAARARSRAAELVEAFDLGAVAHTLVRTLSGGTARRVDLAMSLVQRPAVLFLDEPTTGLDPESRRDAWSIVRSRLAEGVTVVLTTHYLEEAEELSDRLAIMHEGRVVREGTVADIVAGEPARIAFTLPADAPAPPPLLGSAERERGVAGTRYVVTTPQLQEDLFALLAWARDAGVVLGDLDARAASLEQAFLSIAADGAAALDPAA